MKTNTVFVVLILCLAITTSCKKTMIDNKPEQKVHSISQEIEPMLFNAGNFTKSTQLTNKFFQYQVGTKYVFEGESPDGQERNEIVRISANKKIMGINVAVVSDKVWTNGVLEENTRDWFAQDDFGNVWYLGEEVDNFNPDGSLRDHEGSWEAGKNGAIAGIIMLADPKSGDSYQQEFAAGIAEDKAKVVAMGITVSVPLNTYLDCLKTKEWSDLEKGSIDYKYYAPGVGLVKEKKQNTALELVAIE
jgi:hypothetical protein